MVRFKVEDTGIGIKEEDKGKLFKLFGKLSNNKSELNSHGIGLGLTVCNEILMKLNTQLNF